MPARRPITQPPSHHACTHKQASKARLVGEPDLQAPSAAGSVRQQVLWWPHHATGGPVPLARYTEVNLVDLSIPCLWQAGQGSTLRDALLTHRKYYLHSIAGV